MQHTLPQAELLIYGQGPEKPELQALAQQLGVTEHVRLMGYSANLLRDFARAELAVLPSLREGFGNVAVEALAADTPLVASRCLGPDAILQGGRHDVLVPPGDAAALAQAMLQVLRNPPTAAQLENTRQATRPYEAANAALAFEDFARGLVSPVGRPTEDARGRTTAVSRK